MKFLKTPDEIITDTENYIRIIILFSAITIAYNMLAAMMRAVGNSKTPLYFLVVSTFIDIGLDVLSKDFIFLLCNRDISGNFCFVMPDLYFKEMRFPVLPKIKPSMGSVIAFRPYSHRTFNVSDVRNRLCWLGNPTGCGKLIWHKYDYRSHRRTKN